jgi:DNA-binding NarL/FixJ family response regulator
MPADASIQVVGKGALHSRNNGSWNISNATGNYNIQGYILKSAPIEELIQAIKLVAAGGTFFTKDIDINAKTDDARNMLTIDSKKVDEILTKREQEILQLVCKEFSNAEIAEKLFLSIGTVETHRKRIIAKLGVNNTVGLVKFAVRHGLIND